MRTLYKDQIVDYNDGNTEFVKEFNDQIHCYGAIVYNYRDNTYQYVKRFEDISFINELYPWYFSVRPSRLPKGIDIEMTYEFDPDAYKDDEKITALWKEAEEEGQPFFDYSEDGEIFEKEIIPLSASPTKHTIWILDCEGRDFMEDQDTLCLMPVIKYLPIAKEVIRDHTAEPFEKDVPFF